MAASSQITSASQAGNKSGLDTYKSYLNKEQYLSILQNIAGPQTAPSRKTPKIQISKNSHFNEPINVGFNPNKPTNISGRSRFWSDADTHIKMAVIHGILEESSGLPIEDKAILLAIAQHESGFNPDAASMSTSASGIFQIIDETGGALGILKGKHFDVNENIKAGVILYKENLGLLPRNLQGTNKAAYMYKLHHDGPTKDFGGLKIGHSKVVPLYKKFLGAIKDI